MFPVITSGFWPQIYTRGDITLNRDTKKPHYCCEECYGKCVGNNNYKKVKDISVKCIKCRQRKTSGYHVKDGWVCSKCFTDDMKKLNDVIKEKETEKDKILNEIVKLKGILVKYNDILKKVLIPKKKCRKCKKEKPLDEFYKNKSKVNGLMSHCRECLGVKKRRISLLDIILPENR